MPWHVSTEEGFPFEKSPEKANSLEIKQLSIHLTSAGTSEISALTDIERVSHQKAHRVLPLCCCANLKPDKAAALQPTRPVVMLTNPWSLFLRGRQRREPDFPSFQERRAANTSVFERGARAKTGKISPPVGIRLDRLRPPQGRIPFGK